MKINLFAALLWFATINCALATDAILQIPQGGTGSSSGNLSGLNATPPFGAVPRPLSEAMADKINLKDWAKADLLSVPGCSITAGSKSISCVGSAFTSADVNKRIDISGAGGPNTTLSSTIRTVTDATHIVIAETALRSAGPSVISAQQGSTYLAPQGSGYVPGEVITVAGGTTTDPTTLKVATTQINKSTITIVNPGSGGFDNTNCQFTGTTGDGTIKFTIKGTVSGGVLSAITSTIQPGRYTVNPDDIANEPVISTCYVTGAVLSVQMTPLTYTVINAGIYSVAPPATATQASSTGAGTGAGINTGQGYFATGNIQYGTDNGPAIAAAVASINSNYSSTFKCLYAPAGVYGAWTGTIPTFTKGGCVFGDGMNRTYFYLGASFSGNLFSYSNAWPVLPGPPGVINWGAQAPVSVTGTPDGPIAHDFNVVGDSSDPNLVVAVGLYDHSESAMIYNLEMSFIHGNCLSAGIALNSAGSYPRESYFSNIRCYFSGTKTTPSILMTGQGTGQGPNELRFYDLNVFAPVNVAIELSSDNITPSGTGIGVGSISFNTLRVEGKSPFADQEGDLLMLGNPKNNSTVSSIQITDFLGNASYPGYSDVGIYASKNGVQPYLVSIEGAIGSNYGGGLNLAAGRAMKFHFHRFADQQQDMIIGPAPAVGRHILIDFDGQEDILDNLIDPSNAFLLEWRPLFGVYGGGVSFNVHDKSISGGTAPSSLWGIDLTTDRVNGTATASGIGSYILGGSNNQALGTLCGIMGQTNQCDGTYSNVEGLRGWDRNRYGIRCRSSGFFHGIKGESEICEGTLRGESNDTTPVRLFADGGAAATTSNCWQIPNHYTFTMDLDISAQNRITNGNALSYHVHGMLHQDSAGTTSWTPMGTPSVVTKGTQVTAANIAVSADTTNSCLNITWTGPNSDNWMVTAGIRDTETGH